jgi:hypothetical protein
MHTKFYPETLKEKHMGDLEVVWKITTMDSVLKK